MEVLFEQRHHRKVRCSLGVRQRRAGQHLPALRVELLQTLVHETGFPHARLPEHGHHLPMPSRSPFQGLAHAGERGFAPHQARQAPRHRRLETPLERADTKQFIHLERLGQPFDRHRPQRLEAHQPLHQAPGGRGQDNGARGCHLLHARRQVRRRSYRGVFELHIVPQGTDHDLPGVEADADLQGHTMGAVHLRSILTQGRLHGESRITGPQGVILVGQGRPKERHQTVAQHLVHGARVVVYGVHHTLESRVQELLGRFRIEGTNEGQGVGDIGKEHCHLLALAFQRRPGCMALFCQGCLCVCQWPVLVPRWRRRHRRQLAGTRRHWWLSPRHRGDETIAAARHRGYKAWCLCGVGQRFAQRTNGHPHHGITHRSLRPDRIQ